MRLFKLFTWAAFLILISFHLAINAQSSSSIEFNGSIERDTIWSADTIKVTGNTWVADDVTLTIEPGTRVEFQGPYSLFVLGKLLAVGEVDDSIVFTVKDTSGFSNFAIDTGGWYGIRFSGADSEYDTSRIVRCRIEYGKPFGVNQWDAHSQGGGIYAEDYDPLIISHCRFHHNYAWGGGGALRLFDSDALVSHNLFHYNFSEWGGAIWNGSGSDAMINNNIFRNNTTFSGSGGAISTGDGANPVISSNLIIYNNSINGGGAGIHTGSSRAIIDRNIIANNYTGVTGGGIETSESSDIITNNLIVNNTAATGAGGCIFAASNPEFHNNTVCNNISLYSGDAGIAFHAFCEGSFMNNIIWGNVRNPVVKNPLQIHIHDPSSNPNFYNCVIQGGTEEFAIPEGRPFFGDTLDILDVDPRFIDPSGGAGVEYDGLAADWDLFNSSPCINSGKNEAVDYFISDTDIGGNARLMHGIIDIGAYEKSIDIDTALEIIADTVTWLADTVVVTKNIKVIDNAILRIVAGTYVKFKGYYNLDIEGTLLAEGTESDPIWFSVDDTAGFYNNSDSMGSWNGISFNNGLAGANGNMWDNDSSRLIHCIIQYAKNHDREDIQGGAVRTNYFSRLVIKNCTIRFNRSIFGGGVGLWDGSNPLIDGNVFYRNSAAEGGGAISCWRRSAPVITNNIIVNNFIHTEELYSGGGGILCITSDPVIQNNVICNNESHTNGGGIYLANSLPLIANNTICNNRENRGWGAGGIQFYDKLSIYNNILWGNTTPMRNIQAAGNEEIDFYHCNIEGGREKIGADWERYKGDTPGLVVSDPNFVRPTEGAGIEFDGLDADWSLSEFSHNINAGMQEVSNLELPETDIAGNPRINEGIIDIGAYESIAEPIQIIVQPANVTSCAGDSISFSVRSGGPATYQWFRNNQPIPGATDSILKIEPVTVTDEGNYHCDVSNGYGTASSSNVYLIVRIEPRILVEPSSQWLSIDEPFTFRVIADGTSPISIKWYKNDSLLADKMAPEFTLVSPDYPDEGSYTCFISNACGSDSTSPATIYLAPQICMVTVSTTTGKNLVVWEKNSSAPIEYYNVYRESAYANIYDLLGSVPYNELSLLVDSLADPMVQAYLYKISAVDTSGYETDLDLSKTHKTIHLLATKNPETGSTQLDWDRYVGFEYESYQVYRSDTSINFEEVHFMSSSTSTWTDADPGKELQFYRVGAVKSIACVPEGNGKAGTGPYTHSLSNMDDNKKLLNQVRQDPELPRTIRIYPNPFSDRALIRFSKQDHNPYSLRLIDMRGQVMKQWNDLDTDEFELSRDGLPAGLYLIEIVGTQTFRTRVMIR